MPRERWLPCALAAALGCAAVIATYQPGTVGSDALDQLGQARAHAYNDWHPVAMSVLWGALDRIVPGPLLPLILQNLLFWGGLALAAAACAGGGLGAAIVLLVGFWPPLFAYLGDVGKDTQMVAALMAAFGLLAWAAAVRRSIAILSLAVVCLLYGSAVRHNGPVVAAPLALLVPPPKAGRWLAVAAVVAACFCIGPVATRLVGANRGYTFQSIFLFDLAGLSIAEGRDLLPPAFEGPGPMSVERLRELYREDDIQLLAWPDTPGPHLLFSRPLEEIRKLPGLWVRAIARHPLVYLRHRWHLFQSLLGLRIPHHYGPPFPQGIDANNLGLRMKVCRWRGLVVRGLDHIQETFFFHGWVYVVLALGALGFALRRASAHRQLIAVLAASALTNVLPYFVAGPTHHFRFVLWTVAAGLLSASLAAATLIRPGSAFPPPDRTPRTARSPGWP